MFSSILLYWSVLLTGFLIGFYFKKKKSGYHPRCFALLNPVQTVGLAGLIFVLGVGIGADEKVISSLSSIGLSAGIIALSGLSGSVLFAWAARKWCRMDKKGFPVTEPLDTTGKEENAPGSGTQGAQEDRRERND